jgi:hypothetical protein
LTNRGVDQYVQQLTNKMANLKNSQSTCVQTLLAYTQGMACFACSQDFAKFIDIPTTTFRISQDTCDGIVSACSGVYSAVNDLLVTSSQAVTQFVPTMGDLMKAVPDMCGGTVGQPGDCSKYVCSAWVQGIEIADYSWKAKPFPSFKSSPAGIALLAKHEQFLQAVHANAEDKLKAEQELMAQVHHAIVNFAPAYYLPASSTRSSASASATTTTTTTTTTISTSGVVSTQENGVTALAAGGNTYTTDGYKALQVGCADVTCNTPVDPNNNAWIIPVSIISVIAVATVVYCVFRAKNSKDDGNEFQPLQGQQTSTYGYGGQQV